MLTLYFASVQLPATFHMKPRAWHSSRAATTSAQSGGVSGALDIRAFGEMHSFGLLRCVGGDALWAVGLNAVRWGYTGGGRFGG